MDFYENKTTEPPMVILRRNATSSLVAKTNMPLPWPSRTKSRRTVVHRIWQSSSNDMGTTCTI
eukprot:scaffold175960_cov33-Tisochrysis_lutea.AAC.1